MAKFHDRWTVLPHGPVETIDDGILSVEGEIRMPFGRFPRRMAVVRLNDGRTAIFSAVALEERAMRKVEALGTPAFLIVPNGFHRTDAGPFKQRYPQVKVICPPGARTRVEKAVAVDATSDVLAETAVRFVIVPGVGDAEGALVVRRNGRTTLILNDIISNVRHPKGVGAKIMARLFGFGVHGPRMAREVKWLFVKDKPALAAQLQEWASMPGLVRIIPSHGDMIDEPKAALDTVVRSLT